MFSIKCGTDVADVVVVFADPMKKVAKDDCVDNHSDDGTTADRYRHAELKTRAVLV
jgi:hypothetical protein